MNIYAVTIEELKTMGRIRPAIVENKFSPPTCVVIQIKWKTLFIGSKDRLDNWKSALSIPRRNLLSGVFLDDKINFYITKIGKENIDCSV